MIVFGFNMKTQLQNGISPKELGMPLTCLQFFVIIEKLLKTKYSESKRHDVFTTNKATTTK